MSSLFLWGGVALIFGVSVIWPAFPSALVGALALIVGWILLVLGR